MISSSLVSSPSASWLDSVVHIVIVASFGGLVVIVGLVLEQLSEKNGIATRMPLDGGNSGKYLENGLLSLEFYLRLVLVFGLPLTAKLR